MGVKGLRSQEKGKLSLTEEGLDCLTNSPCQYLRKCIENRTENININGKDKGFNCDMIHVTFFFHRALKKKGNTPKYGLIFHSSFIGRAGVKNKGRISRYLANKCSIASRIDCFAGMLIMNVNFVCVINVLVFQSQCRSVVDMIFIHCRFYC